MEQLLGLVIVAGVGWIIWSMLTPPVQFVVTVKSAEVRVRGRVAAQTSAEIKTFFTEHFAGRDRIKVRVLAVSAKSRSRIHIAGNVSDGDRQTIRNFLLTRI